MSRLVVIGYHSSAENTNAPYNRLSSVASVDFPDAIKPLNMCTVGIRVQCDTPVVISIHTAHHPYLCVNKACMMVMIEYLMM
jgi:hypothetical protein